MQFLQTRYWIKREIALKRLDELVCSKHLSSMTDWEIEFIHYWWLNCEFIEDASMKKVRAIYRRLRNANDNDDDDK